MTFQGDRPATRIQRALGQESDRSEENMVRALQRVVDAERAKLGKGPADLKQIQRADSMALGHIDYSVKVAYYAEQVVLADRIVQE